MRYEQEDIFDLYLARLVDSEPPNTFHRWCLLTIIGAWLGRRVWLPFGSARINCNMYVMLMGKAGSRKSTAIKAAVNFIKSAGYTKIAAGKSSKEAFLLDLAGDSNIIAAQDILETNLFGSSNREDAEILIAADEFNVFVGNGNIEFLTELGNMWDYEGEFKSRVKNSASACIYNPTISILAGNTSTNFSLAFPVEAIGQGIFSRLLLIHGDKTGKHLTIPPQPNEEIHSILIERFHLMRERITGAMTLTATAYKLLDKIYKTFPGVRDIRFESYGNRRLTHLIKISTILTASRLAKEITEQDILKANTILAHAEHSMPKALGEFGKARHSDITNKIISVLEDSPHPIVSDKELWKQVYNDLESIDRLRELMTNLQLADKVMRVQGGWISKSADTINRNSNVDFSFLTEEERKSIVV